MRKSELISVINSYATARAAGDANLINLSAQLLQQAIDQLEFEPEQEPETPIEEPADVD